MLIYLHGPDTFRSREQLKKMVAKFKADRDPQGLNVVTLDCTTEEDSKILEQLVASPFLAEKRMVILENLLSATGKKDLQEEIYQRIKEKTIPETTVVLFWEDGSKPKTDIAKKLHKLLAKEKFAQEFKQLQGVQFLTWINNEIKACGGKITNPALQYIVNNVAGDTWRASSLVEQLTAYTDKEIALDDVQLFLDEKADDNIFNLVDAIVARQTKQVYRMIREQYAIGKDAQYVFAMILRQFRILLELRDLYEREDNLQSNELAKQIGLHPFVVKKSLPFVKRYTREQILSIYDKLLQFDINTKTGGGDQSRLLDVFVGSVTV